MGNVPWSDAQDDLLKKYHAENFSFSAIARLINEQTGSSFTRNACIGKAVRTGLQRPRRKAEGRPRLAVNQDRASTQRVRQGRVSGTPYVEVIQPDEPQHLGLSLLQTTDATCKFPRGEQNFTFCGHPTQEGSAYCSFHHRLCWRPPESRPTNTFRRAA